MSFLHGIDHINLPSDIIIANDFVTAVIGLVGTSEKGVDNELILCASEKDDAQFGKTGTIPDALRAIRYQDSAKGRALVLVIKVKATVESITAADIVGEVSEDGGRTGLKLFATAKSRFGFEPMIYIAPHYSALDLVKQELIAITNRTEAMAYYDAPDGLTVSTMLQARGSSGELAVLTEGIKLLFPKFTIANPDYDSTVEDSPKYLSAPMSAYCAGLRAKLDLEEGWHVSSSNRRITGVERTNIPITFDIGDQSCEANLLNAAGITTAVNMDGSGIVEWGNYTAGYPANNAPEAFECVRRVRAIIKRAIDKACARYIDKLHVKPADIDLVCDAVNQYYNDLAGKGIIVGGTCKFDKVKNPVAELAMGHVTFTNDFTPAIPMQNMTFEHKIDTQNLGNIAA